MKRLIFFLCFCWMALAGLMTICFGQDLNSYLTPAGYQNPPLKQGNYMLRLSSYGNTRLYETSENSKWRRSSDWYYYSLSYSLSARGLYGLTDDFTIEGELYITH